MPNISIDTGGTLVDSVQSSGDEIAYMYMYLTLNNTFYLVPTCTYYCSCCSDKLAEREAVGIWSFWAGECVATYPGLVIWPGYETSD